MSAVAHGLHHFYCGRESLIDDAVHVAALAAAPAHEPRHLILAHLMHGQKIFSSRPSVVVAVKAAPSGDIGERASR